MAKVKKADFYALFEALKSDVEKNEILSKDAILKNALKDFERMAIMNDHLWENIETEGNMVFDDRTKKYVCNPAITAYNKNATTLMKLADMIGEKTRAIAVNAEKKSW